MDRAGRGQLWAPAGSGRATGAAYDMATGYDALAGARTRARAVPLPAVSGASTEELARRLSLHLAEWLGLWPPDGELTVVGSSRRTEPGWDGRVRPVAGIATPTGTVVSVPPDLVPSLAGVSRWEELDRRLPALFGRPEVRLGRGVFRWCHAVSDAEGPGVWLDVEDARVPAWLKPFGGEVLVALDDEGRYAAGVGRKQHGRWGQELAVVTEPEHRGQGLARRLVAQAARRVADEGAVATYLHAADNEASARVAQSSGFPDEGWKIVGLPVAS